MLTSLCFVCFVWPKVQKLNTFTLQLYKTQKKQKILTFEKLEAANFWQTVHDKWLKQLPKLKVAKLINFLLNEKLMNQLIFSETE